MCVEYEYVCVWVRACVCVCVYAVMYRRRMYECVCYLSIGTYI